MTFAESLVRLRRFLRDPDGLIWSDDDVETYYNDAQTEIAQKTRVLTEIELIDYPPEYASSFLNDWEDEYADEDKYRPLHVDMVTGDVRCFPWEDDSTTPSDGDAFTQVWEVDYCIPQEGHVQIPLKATFERMRYCAYGNKPISPTTERELMQSDPFYRTRTGEPTAYYIDKDYNNRLVLYPRPQPLESEAGYLVFDDEFVLLGDAFVTMYWVQGGEELLAVYDYVPDDITTGTDTSDIPVWAQKYVECATLERCYGADTDGFIPSLRDYWKQRKELGIQAIYRITRMSLSDRDYRMGGDTGKRQRGRGFSLGPHYPAI